MGLLEELGLNQYESEAYLSLLNLGRATANRISETSGVPQGRIYNVLENLENKGLVSLVDENPKRYEPIEPEKGLGSILNERQKEWNEKKQRIEEMIRSLETRDQPSEPVQIVKTKENYYAVITEMVEEAQEEILSIVGNLTGGRRTSIDGEAEKFLERGGKHKILVSPEKADKEVISRLQNAGTKFRRAELPKLRFMIKDREKALIAIDNPALPYDRFAIEVTGGEFPASLAKIFEKIWKGSEELVL
jgi:sugar-specific transcriptional regulator TrmB